MDGQYALEIYRLFSIQFDLFQWQARLAEASFIVRMLYKDIY